MFGDEDSDEETQAPTTLSSVTTTPGVDAKAETFATTTTTSTQTVTTNSSTAVTLDTRVDPVTTTTTTQTSTPSTTTTTRVTTTASIRTENSSTTGPDIAPRVGPGYSGDSDSDYDDNTEAGDDRGPGDNVNVGVLGPRGLSLCTPLTRAECGVLGDLNIWTDLLSFVEVLTKFGKRKYNYRHHVTVTGWQCSDPEYQRVPQQAGGGQPGQPPYLRNPGARVLHRLQGWQPHEVPAVGGSES